MLLMQLPIQVVAVPAALAPQQGAAPVEPWSLGGGLAPGAAVAPPPPAVAGTASRGSKNHFKGQCRPCRFHEAPEKCPRGEDCNFCHFPHGEEKFAQMEAFSGRAKGRRPRKGAGPREGQPGQRLSLFDHLDLVGSWSGWQQPGGSSSSSSICSWSSQSELAEAPVRGAAWPDFSAEGRQRLEAILLSAQPRHYYD
ncbi:unnamed protein product [Prorocentrum cordatum]|uniref:C3H1-type domain-containing protein n=1 Tax=Prorocentrum cordatum TaxID=2364126 RepID=A0ABN9SUV5_9DINO|nr:unnamed protein product [Polarella glacialis]